MDSGRLIFDQSHSGHHNRGGGSQMLLLGGGNPIFQGGRSMLGMEEGSNKRRPFFTSPDEMLEEYYDEQLPEKKRRLTPEQVEMLEKSFEVENKLEPERKSDLARKLGLQPRQVAVWFQNRRARWKTKQLERDFDRLKASYDALLADHDALRSDNSNLRSQVTSLTEKLQGKNLSPEGVTLFNKDNQAAQATASENMDLHVQTQQQQQQKVEDRLSTGSGGSAVVDGEGAQLVDSSGESYFQESYQGGCGGGMVIHSEEDEASDEGCSYLPAEIFPDSHNSEGWWVWN